MSAINFENIFSVPLITTTWADGPAHNPELLRKVAAHQQAYRGDNRSNVGGWRSETGLLEFLGDPGVRLLDFVLQVTADATRQVFQQQGLVSPPLNWQIQGWANVCENGAFNSTHCHPGATWSAVYYVDAGAPSSPHHSQLQLISPCQGRATTFLPYLLPDTFCINPKAGLLVLIPSYLNHAVLPHHGERARVSIAINLRSDPYP